jgi:uncharacterized protein YjiS (DUF1127 family)
MTYANTTQSYGITFSQRLRNTLDVMRASAAQRRVYNTTVRELVALSDRDLADLGIHRSNIRAIAYAAAFNPK